MPTSSWANRFGFQGRPFAAATGLWDFRARWYDAKVGQFTSEAPLGLAAGDAHLRRFVFNAPTMHTDPSGMLSENVIITQNDLAIGGAAAGFVFGFICSYLNALFAKGATHDEAVRAGWGGAARGGWGGAAAGALIGGTPAVRCYYYPELITSDRSQ
jgi:RHS repeat-associated protein